MENDAQPCPKCRSPYPYQDAHLWICPECGHEFSLDAVNSAEGDGVIKDANGNELTDGDTVTVIKDLKVKGASGSVKVGTKVKNIRLVHDSGDGHDIACKVDGFGSMNLKSEFVKKVN